MSCAVTALMDSNVKGKTGLSPSQFRRMRHQVLHLDSRGPGFENSSLFKLARARSRFCGSPTASALANDPRPASRTTGASLLVASRLREDTAQAVIFPRSVAATAAFITTCSLDAGGRSTTAEASEASGSDLAGPSSSACPSRCGTGPVLARSTHASCDNDYV